MHFQSKDLMIAVVPEALAAAKSCLFRTTICFWPTYCNLLSCNVWSGGCGYFTCGYLSCRQYTCGYLSCGYHSDPCGVISPVVAERPGIDPVAIRDVGEIKALRTELEETIRRLAEVEKEGLPVAPGASVEQLRELEAKTREALTEIQSEIKKRAR